MVSDLTLTWTLILGQVLIIVLSLRNTALTKDLNRLQWWMANLMKVCCEIIQCFHGCDWFWSYLLLWTLGARVESDVGLDKFGYCALVCLTCEGFVHSSWEKSMMLTARMLHIYLCLWCFHNEFIFVFSPAFLKSHAHNYNNIFQMVPTMFISYRNRSELFFTTLLTK